MPLTKNPIPNVPPSTATLSPDVAAAGLMVPPIERLRIISHVQWEDFVLEWAHSLKKNYASVDRYAGAGDMGCDIAAYVHSGPTSPWDNFQCKHYDHLLAPTDVWVELGKLCYYTYKAEFPAPRYYFFVSPFGAGNKLSRLLRKPAEIRQGLIDNWDRYCRNGIKSFKEIPLDAGLLSHLNSFDFSRVSSMSPLSLLEQHKQTPWFSARFGGGLPERPAPPAPPTKPENHEANYIRALLDAYSERLGVDLESEEELHEELSSHFSRSRREFYSAEALREFARDNVPPGTFDSLISEVFDGVVDVIEAKHTDGFERVLETVRQAKSLQITANALIPRVTTTDRGGMCHQLANERGIKWRK